MMKIVPMYIVQDSIVLFYKTVDEIFKNEFKLWQRKPKFWYSTLIKINEWYFTCVQTYSNSHKYKTLYSLLYTASFPNLPQ